MQKLKIPQRTFSQIYLHSHTCVHVLYGADNSRTMCGKETSKIAPHGWLCPEHEEMLVRRPRREENYAQQNV